MPKTVILSPPAPRSGSSAALSSQSTRPSSAAPRSAPRWSGRTSGRTRSSTSSWVRSSRPGRARSPRGRPRSRPGSPRRSPRRRSTRCARRASAPPGSSTRRSAPATSRSRVAGGMESMSNAPYLLKDARFGFRMGDAKAIDAMINDGLTNPFSRQAHGAGGHRGRGRARDDARRHGQVVGPLPRAARSRRPTRAGCPRRSCPSR